MEITWKNVQSNSDKILSDGIYQLLNAEVKQFADVSFQGYGNYLISHQDLPCYIGEAQNVKTRLKQHGVLKSSTFYKNYLKLQVISYSKLPLNLEISDFDCRYVPNVFGRKEVEEFGIVNIPTILNKFQLDKRSKHQFQSYNNLWQKVQSHKKLLMEEGQFKLFNQSFVDWYRADPPNEAGIYWIEHSNDGLIYIGESSNVAGRYNVHSSRTYFSAFRRSVGTKLLNFELKTIKGKKRYFSEAEDTELNKYLRECKLQSMSIQLGRYELEEHLIDKYQPILNRKGKRKKPL